MRYWIFFLIALISGNLFANECYLKGRLFHEDKRYDTFLEALKLCSERDAKILVETGTARDGKENFSGDGGSTLIFADWTRDHGAFFFTVDIDEDALCKAKNDIGKRRTNVKFVNEDSISFLKNFEKPIDFLYLDSFDFRKEDPLPSQRHHLEEIKAAYPWLHEFSIVMIDDCDLPSGGKGKLVIDFLVKEGWHIHRKGYQVILLRD